jgi:hypothetical protein
LWKANLALDSLLLLATTSLFDQAIAAPVQMQYIFHSMKHWTIAQQLPLKYNALRAKIHLSINAEISSDNVTPNKI